MRILLVMGGIVLLLILLSHCQQQSAQAIETYRSEAACEAALHDQARCHEAFSGALHQQDLTAPHYGNQATCEDVYGPGNCVPRGSYAPPGYYPGGYAGGGDGWFIPAMVGFMIGHALGSSPVYQPVYIDRRGYAYTGTTVLGGYHDGGGNGYVYRSSGAGATAPIWHSGNYATRSVSPSRGGFGSSVSKPFSSGSSSPPMALGSSVSRGGFGSSARGFAGS